MTTTTILRDVHVFSPQFDLEGFGEIPWPDFRNALVHPEFVAAVDLHKREQLAAKSLTPTTTAITFQDFVNVVSTLKSLLHLWRSAVPGCLCSPNTWHLRFMVTVFLPNVEVLGLVCCVSVVVTSEYGEGLVNGD